MQPIKRVLLVGGTHGNELIGVYSFKQNQQFPERVSRPSFETISLLGNPQAVAAGTRYIDRDLNRSFATSENFGYESDRAQQIRDEFGELGRTPVDFVIDRHSTTANAGLMLILDNLDPFSLNLAAALVAQQPALKIYSTEGSGRRRDSLRSIAPFRIAIEVGPVSQGTLRADLFHQTEALVQATLDYIEQYNQNATSQRSSVLVYQYIEAVDYPKNEHGEISAMVHPQLQFQDYKALVPGAPMFLSFEGKEIVYRGKTTVYPVFINEAAYYEKGIAMILTKQQQM